MFANLKLILWTLFDTDRNGDKNEADKNCEDENKCSSSREQHPTEDQATSQL